MATPGIQKFNISKTKTGTTKPKDEIAQNLRSQTKAQGTSWGIFAQRTRTGTGVQYNNRTFNDSAISATRHALNDNRTAVFNNIGFGGHVHHNNGTTGINKFMAGMMALNALSQVGMNVVDTVRSARTDNSARKDEDWTTQFDTNNFELTGKLKSANTFNKINSVEKSANEKLSKFQEDYSKKGTDDITALKNALADEKVKDGLQLAGVNIDTSKLSLSNLKINVEDLSTLDGAIKTIDADMEKVTTFINKDLNAGITSLTQKSGEISSSIGTLQSQLVKAQSDEVAGNTTNPTASQIQSEIDKLKDQKKQVDDAKAALSSCGDVRSSAETLLADLKNQQISLADIKQVKSEMADKKYEVAKQIQKDVTQTQRKLDSLGGKIEKAKTDEEKQKLIKEYNGLVKNLAGFRTDIEAAGSQPIKNSKGKEIDLSKITFKSYDEIRQDTGTSTSSTTGTSSSPLSKGFNGSSVGLNLKDPKGTLTIGGKKYIPAGNSYLCEGKVLSKELVTKMYIAQKPGFTFDSSINLSLQ